MQFKVIKRGQPGVPGGGDEKYYAAPHYAGSIDLEELSRRISIRTTVTDTDAIAVLSALVNIIPEQLKEGKIVRIGNLGNFRLSMSSNGESSAGEVTARSIRKTRVLFHAGLGLENQLDRLPLEKVLPYGQIAPPTTPPEDVVDEAA